MQSGIDLQLHDWAKNSDSVVFTGQVDNIELKKYYAAIDCYVHPTYREGFGMVLQEAAAMRCTVITTDIPGASEVLENEISCLLANPKDAISLEEKMKKVMDDKELRDYLGYNARKRVETNFERKKMLQTQKLDYQSLLGEV